MSTSSSSSSPSYSSTVANLRSEHDITEQKKQDGIKKKKDNESDDDNEEIFEVDRILADMIDNKGVHFYQVRWKNYGPEEDSWEPEDNLAGASAILKRYLQSKEKKTGSSKKSKKSSKTGSKKTQSDNDDLDENEKSDADNDFISTKRKSKKSHKKEQNSSKSRSNKSPLSRARESEKLLNNSTSANISLAIGNLDSSASTERVVARRKNLNNNLRWITESCGESSDDEKDEMSSSFDKTSITTITAIKNEVDTSVVSNSAGLSSFVTSKGLIISSFKDNPANNNSNNNNDINVTDADTTNSTKLTTKEKATGKKHKLTGDNSAVEISSKKPTLTFTGIYRENKNDLNFVAIDNRTKKREVYELGDAFMADGWSLCRFLSSRVRFDANGDVFVNGDRENENS